MVENSCADDLQIGCMIYDRMNILDVYQKKLDNVQSIETNKKEFFM